MDRFTALVGSDDGDPEDIVDTPATISVRKLAPCPVSGPGLVPRLPPTPDTVSSLQFLATSGRTESIVDHGHIKAEEVALKHGDRRHQRNNPMWCVVNERQDRTVYLSVSMTYIWDESA